MARVNPSSSQKDRLLAANAFRCCTCKRSGVGLHFHHVDGDSSRTVDENLAVLCVEDHDQHHRPGEYTGKPRHLELGADQILQKKVSWEAFVAEAHKPQPQVLATLSAYGSLELVHSLQLVLQWPDERIEYARSFHLLDGNLEQLTDAVFKEVGSIGPSIKLALVNQPLPVEHCPCCGSGFSRTTKTAFVTRLTDPEWDTRSACSIYVNPTQPSLALLFALRDQALFSVSLHLCGGEYLHYSSDSIDDRIAVKSTPSVRTQATAVVEHVLREWAPTRLFIGTGDPDAPTLIPRLDLPKIWEQSVTQTIVRRRKRGT